MKPAIGGPEILDREKQLNAVSWGVFFLWVGVAWLAGIGWGPGLMVTGLIILGTQAARRSLALGFDAFWTAIGILFVVGGIWAWLDVRVSLVPLLCLLAGIALLGRTLVHRRAH